MSIDPGHAVAIRAALLRQLTVEHHHTISVLEHLPADMMNYTPDRRLRSFGDLAWHIYIAGAQLAEFMESGRMTPEADLPPVPGSKAALIEACERLNREFANRVRSLSADTLVRTLEMRGMGPMAAVTYILWHQNHLVHHRAQLALYLRLMGGKVPPLYGPTLDYPEDV
jgi:uncharacterized damage-inducible protein DinB